MTSLTGLQEALRQPAPTPSTGFAAAFIAESIAILESVDIAAIERMAAGLARVRELGGRLFILGVGGSAGHAGHAVNDFRKLCGFEAYAPTDNVRSSPPEPTTKAGTPVSPPGFRARASVRAMACWFFRWAAEAARKTYR